MIHYGPLVRILHCCFSQAVTNVLAEMELTSAQGHILGYLEHRKDAPPCPRDIEEEFHLSHPTVSGLLARLEKKDFIALRPDPDDRRCKRVYILPRGNECSGRVHRLMRENEKQMIQGFTPEEQQQFADFLARAIHNLGGEANISFFKEENNQCSNG